MINATTCIKYTGVQQSTHTRHCTYRVYLPDLVDLLHPGSVTALPPVSKGSHAPCPALQLQYLLQHLLQELHQKTPWKLQHHYHWTPMQPGCCSGSEWFCQWCSEQPGQAVCQLLLQRLGGPGEAFLCWAGLMLGAVWTPRWMRQPDQHGHGCDLHFRVSCNIMPGVIIPHV